MLKSKKHKIIAIGAAAAAVAAAALLTTVVISKSGFNNYALSNVALVVSNSDKCGTIFSSLGKLSEQPLKLEFSNTKEKAKFSVADATETLKNHIHSTVKQNVSDNVSRVGVGEFELDGQKIEYVITASADAKNPSYKYQYPVIFTGDNANCYFTALVQPSTDAVEDFLKNVKSDNATKAAEPSAETTKESK